MMMLFLRETIILMKCSFQFKSNEVLKNGKIGNTSRNKKALINTIDNHDSLFVKTEYISNLSTKNIF